MNDRDLFKKDWNCAHCLWWLEGKKECHFAAPVAINDSHSTGNVPTYITVWPHVEGSDFCGSFTEIPRSIVPKSSRAIG